MRKSYLLLPLTGVLLLSACGSSISSIKPLSMEEVTNKRMAEMSQEEKEGLIYKAVSDRVMVDSKNLMKIPQSDLNAISNVFTTINSSLQSGHPKILKEDYANYLLLEFARTPYQWKQTKIDAVGFDPSARLYFVDVTYETTDKMKNVVPKSKIPNGSPDGEALKQKRYQDYTNYLTAKTSAAPNAGSLLRDFKKAWGNPNTIRDEQQGYSLIQRTAQASGSSSDLGRLTYSGLVKNSMFNTGAKMTVRYVLKYKYNLGEETDLDVASLYVKNYDLNDAKGIETQLAQGRDKKTGTEVLKPFIDKLLISYHKAVEESNDLGLYSLFTDYGDVDKYYRDISDYTYNNAEGYKFDVLSRQGTTVYVKVDRINHIRAKGANMSMPTYDESWIYTLKLDSDDTIRLDSVNLVKSTLVGEPLSIIKDVSGVSDMIQYSGESFTKENKAKIIDAIKKFSKVVYTGKTDTKEFSEAVDVGISDNNLEKMTKQISSLQDNNKKTTYIVSWNTKTNVYASLTIREIFETNDQGNLDTEATIDLVNRDGVWKVSNYTRTMSIKTNSPTVDEKNSIAVDK